MSRDKHSDTWSTAPLLRVACPMLAITVLGWLAPAHAQGSPQLSESEFLNDVPIVLSVSRMPQRLDETPGSVTLLDRAMIRATGARDVADLLRYVPGFEVSSSFESNAPQASYHDSLKDYSNRVQVMVDGRSVYSPFLLGSTGPGLQAVAIDDIERIEVIRGTNAAAYGARAFLGMINIVTRDTIDTMGVTANLAQGDNGIRDTLVRLGWGDNQARFRITADQRTDSGLLGAGGRDHVRRVNFRSTFQASDKDRLDVRAGQSVIDAGVGSANGGSGNGLRNRWIDTSFVQVDWSRILHADADLAFQYAHMDESIQDQVPNSDFTDVLMNRGGRASSDSMMAQHTARFNPSLQWIWGAELRQERIASRILYDTDDAFATNFYRIFFNAQWHIVPSLVLNAGSMLERNSVSGDTASPRTMLNWHLMPGQTLRYGVSKAHRPPSTFENFGHLVYRSPSLAAAGFPKGEFVDFQSRGGLVPESIVSREVGYLGTFDSLQLDVDLRVFDETSTNIIREKKEANDYTKYFVNIPGGNWSDLSAPLNTHGAEFQLKWRPWQGGQWSLSHLWIDNGRLYPRMPLTGSSLLVTQRFPMGFHVSLMRSRTDAVPEMPNNGVPGPAVNRTDLRIAKELQWGSRKGEVSWVVQNAGTAYPDFDPNFQFVRQAYVMLRLEN
ncbi:MAG TPA: TonB-dependent receptor [Rhodoferax sp.]|jgi:iron complex outermembrane receptor protein|nr:TonB-dependent receptor [Rhodoferax sp.]HNV59070.1 TonB-dependent receptor [Rhodoferax sp.]HPW29054.1 TonB-dependent receptor [Rhodoferax sp.]